MNINIDMKQGIKQIIKINRNELLIFLAVQILIPMFLMPVLIFYGPFENITRLMVGSSMQTLSHQYIAKFFLTDEAIDRILGTTDNADGSPQGEPVDNEPKPTPESMDYSQKEHNARIERIDFEGKTFKGILLKIYDPSRIKVGYSQHIPRYGETTSAIAKRYGAIAAINGGGFGDYQWAGTGGSPVGVIISGGEIVYNEHEVDPSVEMNIIGFNDKNQLIVGKYTVDEMKEAKIMEAVSFVESALVINGKPMITHGDGNWGIAPRTAIGQTKEGEVLFMVIDGRSWSSLGATLREVQDVMLNYGAYTASFLDGGSSTTMYLNGKVINNPTDPLGERSIPTVFMVMP